MQRLEVSGAVRPLYVSLGVKGLMKQEYEVTVSAWISFSPIGTRSSVPGVKTAGA
jgi:hypothetical protein